MKAAKFAISGAIPVVGGILSDAAETVLASAGILKGTVGVFGMVTILGICLIPLLQISFTSGSEKRAAASCRAAAPVTAPVAAVNAAAVGRSTLAKEVIRAMAPR